MAFKFGMVSPTYLLCKFSILHVTSSFPNVVPKKDNFLKKKKKNFQETFALSIKEIFKNVYQGFV